MPSFQPFFVESRGKPIQYQGKTLVMADDFPTEGAKHFRVVMEESKGEWRQGVALTGYNDKKVNGAFKVAGQVIKKGFVLWRDTAPQTTEFEIAGKGKVTSISVKNVWDIGRGVMDSWVHGAAMIVEPIPGGRRYRCNDGFPDDDFDDIVFRVERIPPP